MAKFSVPADKRKCPCGRIDVALRTVLAWLAAFAVLFVAGAATAEDVPLPRPRPPVTEAAPATAPPAAPEAAMPSAPSACRVALDDTIAIAVSVAPVVGPGECGGDDLVRLEAIVLPDRRRVTLQPAATLRCDMATEVAGWVRTDVAPLVEADGARLSAIEVADSFSCRGRNRVKGAKLSEHGRANAIDIRALRLVRAPALTLPDRATPRALRVRLKDTMCARFTTVLGPGSDGYHEDHIHLDRRQRGNGYRICQWTIEDEAPPPSPPAVEEVASAPAPAPATGPDRKSETSSKPDPKPDPKSDPKSDPKPGRKSGPKSETGPAPPPDARPAPAEVAALSAVPLPRPRPASAPASAEGSATPAAASKRERKAQPRRAAARRSPALPWPLSLFPAR